MLKFKKKIRKNPDLNLWFEEKLKNSFDIPNENDAIQFILKELVSSKPHIKSEILEIVSHSKKFKLIREGGNATAYYFVLNKKIIVNNIFLYSNKEYVLKINFNISLNCLNLLKKLSKYGIIPKIYTFIDKHIIMDYIPGITLYKFRMELELLESEELKEEYDYVYQQYKKLEKILFKLQGFNKWDFNLGNILVSRKNNKWRVHLIDPCY